MALEKALALMENEDFVKKVAACGSLAEAKKLFAANGAEVSDEELKTVGSVLKAIDEGDGEIPDELAEKVAGGFGLKDVGPLFNKIGTVMQKLGDVFTDLLAMFTEDGTKKEEEQKKEEPKA